MKDLIHQLFISTSHLLMPVDPSTTVVGEERCESGRIGLTANELTW